MINSSPMEHHPFSYQLMIRKWNRLCSIICYISQLKNCAVLRLITLASIFVFSWQISSPPLHTSHSFSTGSSSAIYCTGVPWSPHWFDCLWILLQSQCSVPQNPQGSEQYLTPSQTLSLGRLINLAFLLLRLLLSLRLIPVTLACIVQWLHETH